MDAETSCTPSAPAWRWGEYRSATSAPLREPFPSPQRRLGPIPSIVPARRYPARRDRLQPPLERRCLWGDRVLPLHPSVYVARWMLNRVQHDVWVECAFLLPSPQRRLGPIPSIGLAQRYPARRDRLQPTLERRCFWGDLVLPLYPSVCVARWMLEPKACRAQTSSA